jgi:hypothetical protein
MDNGYARLRHGQQSHEVIAMSAAGQFGIAATGQDSADRRHAEARMMSVKSKT